MSDFNFLFFLCCMCNVSEMIPAFPVSAVNLDGSCHLDDNCLASTAHSGCIGGKCQCATGYYRDGNQCAAGEVDILSLLYTFNYITEAQAGCAPFFLFLHTIPI